MDSNPSTVTIWQSGRLAPQVAPRRAESGFERAQWLGAALLVMSAVVLALFVGVLERAVSRGEMTHQAQRSRAVAEAQCEAGQPAASRGACSALFDGAPAGRAGDDAAGSPRLAAVSMSTLEAAQ